MQSERSIWIGALLSLQILLLTVPNSDGKTIKFAKYEWNIRNEQSNYPGPNRWSENNVWLDNENHVHLEVNNSGSEWSCAELYTTVKFGFGTYRWFVEGNIDRFDPNIVLGLFTYGKENGTDEIDIEVAKWGTGGGINNLWYTIYPSKPGAESVSNGTVISLGNGNYTTHKFTWNEQHVSLQSQYGFTHSQNDNIFFKYQTPDWFEPVMPVASAPLHMNLWNFKGRPPTDGQKVEVIIHDFEYKANPSGKEGLSSSTTNAVDEKLCV